MKQSIKYLFLAGVLFTGALFGLPGSASAQDGDEIRIDTGLVITDVLVRDKKGEIVRGLKADQFEIFNDGIKQTIETFSADDASVSFGIVFDMHTTTEESSKTVLGSLRQFSRGLSKTDDVFLVAFNMHGQQTFDFVPDLDQLNRHMQRPEKTEPHTLYDAVYYASDVLQGKRNQKKVLLIISDNTDHHSKYTLAEVRKKLANIKTEAYAIVFDDWNDLRYTDIAHDGEKMRRRSEASPRDRAAMAELTAGSGGETYFDGSENALQLLNIYNQISQEVRSHYTLGFYPAVIDAKRHDLRVRLKDGVESKGWNLTYRTSYQMQPGPEGK